VVSGCEERHLVVMGGRLGQEDYFGSIGRTEVPTISHLEAQHAGVEVNHLVRITDVDDSMSELEAEVGRHRTRIGRSALSLQTNPLQFLSVRPDAPDTLYDPLVSVNSTRGLQFYVDDYAGDPTHPTILFLHGLGATGQVWDRLLSTFDWPGRVVVPDLRGHGASPTTARYSFGAIASDVAELLANQEHYYVVGHSLGGAVGLCLASGLFGPPPTAVATLGVKIRWSDEEIERMPTLAAKPPRTFENRPAAADWFLKLSGLASVIAVDDPMTERGVTETNDGWRVTQDPATVIVGAPDIATMLGQAQCPVRMGFGDSDPLVKPEHHRDLGWSRHGPPDVFVGTGHNCMVEDPRAVITWLRSTFSC
jgi:pimeloyl-ACP methyl ester carboxylesterase